MTLDTRPLFTGQRVRLTALRGEDIPVVTGWYEDSRFARNFDGATAVPRSMNRVRQVFDEDDRSNTGFSFAIRPVYSEDLIGVCAVDGIMWNNRSGWVSIGIGDPAHRGHGYGQEAFLMLMRFSFHEINLHRIQLTVFSYNMPAIRLYERLGFVREGAWRQAIYRDGQFFDQLMYSMLAPEFAALHGHPDTDT
jgi:RimJ/RimL family protein N-acetyltransferase